jgi:hypothetical protein
MEWTPPKLEEVRLNCEINSYATAALQPSVGTRQHHGFALI